MSAFCLCLRVYVCVCVCVCVCACVCECVCVRYLNIISKVREILSKSSDLSGGKQAPQLYRTKYSRMNQVKFVEDSL